MRHSCGTTVTPRANTCVLDFCLCSEILTNLRHQADFRHNLMAFKDHNWLKHFRTAEHEIL